MLVVEEMLVLLMIPFFIQGLIMFIDEFYFHRKRGLLLWERVGHPLDSFTVLVCYLFISLNVPSTFNLYIYAGLCLFSSLFITKDEFVHTVECEATENWVHSILFILHPITFMAAGLIWFHNLSQVVLISFPATIFVFMLYQIIYWSRRGIRQSKN